MTNKTLILATALLFGTTAKGQNKLITRNGHAEIYSHTTAEDISAVNDDVAGTLDLSSGEVGVSVPVQSFHFERSMMQEHFNSPNFLDSKQFPRITFKGVAELPTGKDLSANGDYDVSVKGELTIRNVSKSQESKAKIHVEGGKATVTNEFVVKDISAFGIGKPMGSKKNNVAEDILVRFKAVYEKSAQ
jgi:polyisoprenoid-binding protein YceI